jgi:hypothetical protein
MDTSKEMDVLGSVWFTNRNSCIGIVRVKTEYDGIKYFIANTHGKNQKEDEEHVALWGSTFPQEAGDILFGIR